MVAVLDPDAQSGIVEGYFAWSEEDSSAYLIAESGALPVNGTRVLTTLDDAQLSRMGSDWFQLAGQIVAIVEPVAPITVGTNGFEGQISGIFIAATKDVRLAAGSTFSRVVLPELALSLDFTSSLPAGETASGGENGTRINSSGLIEAATAPRYDHSIAGVPRGPILEGDRTNLRTNCRDFTGWLATNFTITGDDAAGPDGAVSADLATRTSTALANIATGHTKAASALAFAHSVSAKKSAGNYLATRSQNAAVFAGAVFDLTDDSIHYESGANTLTQIEAGPNGYSRASVSGVSDATTWLAMFLSFNTDGGNIGSADSVDNSAGHLDLAQSELGAFPSSPIITAGSTVTRTADSLVRAGTGFSSRWNADEMTIRVPVFDSPGIGIRTIWQAEDPSDPAGNRYVIYTDGTDLKFKIVEGGVATCEIIIGTITPRADHSVVVAWAVDDVAGSIDGNPEVTSGDTAGSLPSVGQRRIGASSTADEELYGHVPYDNWYIRRMPNVAALAS